MDDTSAFRRAIYLGTATSLLVPLVGVAIAPILAQTLGVSGRGELATAMAPNSLVVSVATLGLPDALTLQLARRPWLTRRALAFSSAVSALIGVLCFVVAVLSAHLLTNGDSRLADLVLLGTALAVPTLMINLLRGAAMGRQMWGAVAVERGLNSMLRLVVLGVLASLGQLTVTVAVLVVSVAPLVAGAAYWKLFVRVVADAEPKTQVAGPLLAFGTRTWLASVAGMVNGRISQLVITPLSDVRELGLFVVAVTISDVPFIAAAALSSVMFGVNAREADIDRLTIASRLTIAIGAVGASAIGACLPWCIAPLFGEGFYDALLPTLLLLAASVLGLPGLIAVAGLGAWDRPTLRSVVVVVGLVANTASLVVLIPAHGAVGAAVAAMIGASASSCVGVGAMSRVARTTPRAFLVPRRSDFLIVGREAAVLVGSTRRRAL